MQVSMYAVRVRFVCDAKGPLEAKPRRTIVTIARNHEEAHERARAHYFEVASAGVTVEIGEPYQLADTVAIESLVYA